jgi:beta-glucosidase/6-phospho-beta-glucosidase/beta-galactosidase
VLLEAAALGLPLVIAGAGLPQEEDPERCRYILDHTHVTGCALEGGIDVRGYFHRSLLDGFEYDHGFTRRYGILHVNRETLARTPNPSAYLLKDIAEARGIRTGAVARYCPGWEPEKEDET